MTLCYYGCMIHVKVKVFKDITSIQMKLFIDSWNPISILIHADQ